jgi:hypothetical protein
MRLGVDAVFVNEANAPHPVLDPGAPGRAASRAYLE